MTTIAVFSKFFGYDVGGAERSMVELLKAEEAKGHRIVAMVVADVKGYTDKVRRMPLPATWEIRECKLPADFSMFRFVEYGLNRSAAARVARLLQGVDVLYAYGTMAPAAINAFNGPTVYLARDEYGVGWNVNYHGGLRRWVQSAYNLTQAPLRALWLRDLRAAAARSRLIGNSKFIACELGKLAPGRPVEIQYPKVDLSDLRSDYDAAAATQADPKGVVVIGDNVLKGGDIARRVAACLPATPFYLFDRACQQTQSVGNLHLMPWQSAGQIYSRALVTMVPSRWAEAFGRVIVESQSLGIPVVASARGGIPEVISDPKMLVADIEDPRAWVDRLNTILPGNAALRTAVYCS
jgi:glycosyltransferase involved in cell wall biosynthesis